MLNHYKTINQSEIKDFRDSCKSLKFDPEQFYLKEHSVEEILEGHGLFHSVGKVTISHNGSSMTYVSGHGSKWPTEFHADLESGKFN